MRFADSSFTLVDHNGNTITDQQEGLLLYKSGTVCDDIFSNNSASAICKEMGYRTSINWSSGEKWSAQQRSYSIKLDQVRCSAPSWSSCTYNVTNHDCDHSEDVFLSCGCIRSILSCTPGFYLQPCTCTICPVDTYQPLEGTQGSCTECPGSSTSDPGSSYCNCLTGTFWNETNCENCTEDSVSQEGALQCIECPLNSTSFKNGYSCSCPVGSVWSWDSKNIGSCKLCLPGTYKNEEGTSCVTCPLGTSSGIGFDHCVCRAGRFWNKTSCESCVQGSVSQEGAIKCIECPTGSSSQLGASRCSCPVGMMWSWDEQYLASCKPCQPGSYRSDKMESCKSCPIGTTSTVGSDHCSCTAGMFWNETNCQVCPEDSVSQEGSLQCQECPLNSIPGPDNMICICSEGKSWVWDGLGVGSCKGSQNRISPFAWFSVVLIVVIVILAILICLLVYERRTRGKGASPAARVKYNVDKNSTHTVNGETSEVQTQEEALII